MGGAERAQRGAIAVTVHYGGVPLHVEQERDSAGVLSGVAGDGPARCLGGPAWRSRGGAARKHPCHRGGDSQEAAANGSGVGSDCFFQVDDGDRWSVVERRAPPVGQTRKALRLRNSRQWPGFGVERVNGSGAVRVPPYVSHSAV